MLEAVRQTADSTAAKIAAIRTVQDEIHDQARGASNGGRNADFLATAARRAMRASRYQLLPTVTKGSLVTVLAVSLPRFIGNDHQHRTSPTASMIKQNERRIHHDRNT
jgi:hypothetical protein